MVISFLISYLWLSQNAVFLSGARLEYICVEENLCLDLIKFKVFDLGFFKNSSSKIKVPCLLSMQKTCRLQYAFSYFNGRFMTAINTSGLLLEVAFIWQHRKMLLAKRKPVTLNLKEPELIAVYF